MPEDLPADRPAVAPPAGDAPAPPGHPHGSRRRTLRFGTGPEWSGTQLALTAASTVGVVAYLASLYRVAGGFDAIWWGLAAVPLLTIRYAGSGAPFALWLLLLYGWVYLTPAGSFSWWSLGAAGGAVLAHGATSLSASVPASGSLPRALVLRWARHVGLAFVAAVATALAASLLVGRPLALGPAAYVVGLAGVAGAVWLLRTSPIAD